jgi:hypothetical protein
MKKYLYNINNFFAFFGLDLRKTTQRFRRLPFYLHDFRVILRQKKKSNISFRFGKFYPCLGERFTEGGIIKGHYFHQDLLIARKIFINNPQIHVDVGSRTDGFVAHVAIFRKIEVFDIRPIRSNILNIKFLQADLMKDIDKNLINYCDSISCLHAIEHFGLGRYGDPVKFDGYINGLDNLHRILKAKGKFYFSVPIGPQRIEFNAHRVFSIKYLLELFQDKYIIDSFSYVDDEGDLHEDAKFTKPALENNFGCQYGCGIFEMTKL